MKKNIKGFSIIIALGLTLVMSLLAISILEYIIPFSRDIKGIENSSKAYYQATTGIEDGLYHFANRPGITDEDSKDYVGDITYQYNTSSSGTRIPSVGKGNSDYNINRNKIAIGKPIQLQIGDGLVTNFDDLRIFFAVPNVGGALYLESLSGGINDYYINWQLSSKLNSINATGSSLISATEISDSHTTTPVNIFSSNLQGMDLNGNQGNDERYINFYNYNCGVGEKCTLKFSLIKELQLTDGKKIPFIEFVAIIDVGTSGKIPLQYSRIESNGKSMGFKKSLEVKVSQETVNEAFDFTIFQ